MSRDKWNEICFILSENIHRQISEDLFEKYMIQALRVLGWKQYLNEIDVRSSFQIGASNRIAPDLIIKSETQERLFVIEIKQPHLPLSKGFQKQLFSYMRLLKLEYGLLIGSEIQLFYDGDIIPHEDPILLKTITFKRDSEKGVRFVNLFGKDTFSFDQLNAEVNSFRSKQEQKKQSIRLRKELLTDQFHRDVIEAIKINLNAKYDSAVIESVFRNITISINEDVAELYNPESPIAINSGEGQNRFVGFRESYKGSSNKGRQVAFLSDNSEVVDYTAFDLEGQNFLLKRFRDSSIRIFDVNNQICNITVKPILRKIIDTYNLNIKLYFDSGSPKNTRTLGKEIIEVLNDKFGFSGTRKEEFSDSPSQSDYIIELANLGLQQYEMEERLAQRCNKTREWAKGRLNVYFRHYGDCGILDCRVNLDNINPLNLSQKYLEVYRYLSRKEDKNEQQVVRKELYKQMNPKNPNKIDSLDAFLNN